MMDGGDGDSIKATGLVDHPTYSTLLYSTRNETTQILQSFASFPVSASKGVSQTASLIVADRRGSGNKYREGQCLPWKSIGLI